MPTVFRKGFLWLQYVLLVIGFTVLSYCASSTIQEMHFQSEASAALKVEPTEPSTSLRASDLIGKLIVPNAHVNAAISEGTAAGTLRVAIGHVAGTALPGARGNVALAAHRDVFFRHLGELRPGDVITVATPTNRFVYHVSFTTIVNPNETWVLDQMSGHAITLITCYPFYFVGSAPKRFIVRAHQVPIQ